MRGFQFRIAGGGAPRGGGNLRIARSVSSQAPAANTWDHRDSAAGTAQSVFKWGRPSLCTRWALHGPTDVYFFFVDNNRNGKTPQKNRNANDRAGTLASPTSVIVCESDSEM